MFKHQAHEQPHVMLLRAVEAITSHAEHVKAEWDKLQAKLESQSTAKTQK